MKTKLLTLFGILLSGILSAQTSVFWNEDFNNGCQAGCTAAGYISQQGTWTQAITGTEGITPNQWFVSCAENGFTAGNCGAACTTGSGATGASLHLSANINHPFFGGNPGALYDAGGLCSINICPQTSRRIESPVINCTGRTAVSVAFDYIEGGQTTLDNATLWYFDGSAWSQLADMPKTLTDCPGGQGRWAAFTVNLPNSANNNPNVKIGFQWVNNDDGVGTDPSFAVDNIEITGTDSESISDVTISGNPNAVCAGDSIFYSGSAGGNVTQWTWLFQGGVPSSFNGQNPGWVHYPNPGTFFTQLTASNSVNSAPVEVPFLVRPLPTGNVSTIPSGALNNAGIATVIPSGGSGGPYTIVWNTNPPQNGENAINLPAGTYTANITDAQGCSSEVTAEVQLIVGVDTYEKVVVSVFPNPADDFIQINLPKDISLLTVYGMDGKMHIQQRSVQTENIQLDISRLAAGEYVLQMFSEGKVFTGKFIKR